MSSKRKVSGESPPRYWMHAAIVVVTCAVGVLLGAGFAYFWGTSFKADAPADINTIGRIETIRLPVGARKLRDIRTFTLIGGGGDDYGRVYVNNYLVGSGENPKQIFYTDNPLGKNTRAEVVKYIRDRAEYMVEKRDIKYFLKPGRNYIVQELENVLGTCVSGMDLFVNGVELEHFSQIIPDNWYIESGISNPSLLSKYEAASVIDVNGPNLGILRLSMLYARVEFGK